MTSTLRPTNDMRRVFGCALLIALFAIASACAGTPVTEPPSVAPPELPNVEANDTLPGLTPGATDSRPVGLSGGRGAIAPNALVWTINLDSGQPPVLARADADGSFEVPVFAAPGQELRMHVLVDGEPSLPLDMVLGDDLRLTKPTHGACVTTTPRMVKFDDVMPGSSDQVVLSIDNSCDAAIDLAVSLHASTTDFALGELDETRVAAGESTMLPVSFAPSPGGVQRSGIAFIQVSGAEIEDRIAVSLWGHAR